jgi:hypothetical protein
MDESTEPKPYPSFFEENDGLPAVEENISTGFPSINEKDNGASSFSERLDTASIPSFSSAFDLED